MKLAEEKKESVKKKLGECISIMHKPESYLMVGIEDGYSLYFAGEALEKGAYVSVSLFGKPAAGDCLTHTILNLYNPPKADIKRFPFYRKFLFFRLFQRRKRNIYRSQPQQRGFLPSPLRVSFYR